MAKAYIQIRRVDDDNAVGVILYDEFNDTPFYRAIKVSRDALSDDIKKSHFEKLASFLASISKGKDSDIEIDNIKSPADRDISIEVDVKGDSKGNNSLKGEDALDYKKFTAGQKSDFDNGISMIRKEIDIREEEERARAKEKEK